MNASKIREEYGMQMDMSKDPAKEGMDMNHSKVEGMKRTTSIRSKWICQEICKRKEWKWIILRWKDENGRYARSCNG
jgi:hypothetical protein